VVSRRSRNTAGAGAKSVVRIVVVDDHPAVREGLAAQISTQADLKICGEAEDVAAALGLIERVRPDVAIVDISLKNGNGIELIKRITARDADVRVLVWSMYPEHLYAERALRAGAQGYVHKGRATREILDGLRAVMAGKVYLSDDLTDRLLHRLVGSRKSPGHSPSVVLSDREMEAFELIGDGLTTLQIAKRMHVSTKTVETYRVRIKEKLGVKNVNELIQRAVQSRLQRE
jgi:DNA-binding NarL/FixJ family response regulator